MNNFKIDFCESTRVWTVTVKNEFTVGPVDYIAGVTVLTYPATKDKYEDVRYLMGLLVTKISVVDHYCSGVADRTLAIIPSDKFTPITVLSDSPTRVMPVSKMFRDVPVSLDIRNIALNSCKNFIPGYEHFVTGAFVSTRANLEGIEALRDKMAKTSATMDISPTLFKAVLGYYLIEFQTALNQTMPSIDPDVAYNLKFNPNAGMGFKHYDLPTLKTKRDFAPFARRALANILTKLFEYIGMSEYLIPVMVHIYMAKPEVRPFDGDPDKIRLIGMVGQLHDMITKLVDTAYMIGFRRWRGCMIGSSIWSSLPYLLLYNLQIPEFNMLPEEVRREFSVSETFVKDETRGTDLKYVLWTADASGQDVSFTASGLFAFLMLRYFWVNTSDKSMMDGFNELFAYETACANAKIVQWFGKMWYIVTGIMTSGYHTTSDIDSLMLVTMITCAVVEITLAKGIHPKFAMGSNILSVYGDDIVGRMPVEIYQHMGVDDSGYPVELARVLQRYGVTLKRGETKFYYPKFHKNNSQRHINRFFTKIRDDEIVSEGIHMLQRYFVKYDMDMNPLHPDSKQWCFIMPWRHTGAYATRIATDAQGFKGKLGRAEEGDMDVRLGAYVKAFGLLMDAGPNRKAHLFIKDFLNTIARADPRVPLCAYQVARGELSEVFKKLDPYKLEDCLPAITDIWDWTDERSYLWVTSHIGVTSRLMEIKNPYFKFKYIKDFDGIEGRPKYYASKGKIYSTN